MSNHRLVHWALLPIAMLAAATMTSAVLAAEAGPEAAQLTVFKADNTNYFALGLGPVAGASTAGPHDVVVLVNTSVVQTGEYRTQGSAAV